MQKHRDGFWHNVGSPQVHSQRICVQIAMLHCHEARSHLLAAALDKLNAVGEDLQLYT